MTLKETITRELLDSVDDPSGLEAVFQRHSRSKGPFYLALAEATTQLQARFDQVRQDTIKAESARDRILEESSGLVDQQEGLHQEVQALVQQLEEARTRLDQVRGPLDRAEALARRGFGEAELGKLYDLLGQVAAEQGLAPEEGVAQFFETVRGYQQVVSLDLEARRAESRVAQAKAEAERWEAEARHRETQSRARSGAIDLTERLLSKGVKAQDLPRWQKVLDQAGVAVEELLQALKGYASLEGLVRSREGRCEGLKGEMSTLEDRVKALTQQRDHLHTSLQEVKERGLAEVRKAGRETARQVKEAGGQVREHLKALALAAEEYARVREEAATLGEYVQLARALQSNDPQLWQSMPREVVEHLLSGAVQWCEGPGRDLEVAVPEMVRRGSNLSSWATLRLSKVLLWALAGVFHLEERRALPSRP